MVYLVIISAMKYQDLLRNTVYRQNSSGSVGGIVLVILAVLVITPFVLMSGAVYIFGSYTKDHAEELTKLESETAELFGSAALDCYDVELRNQCYIRTSGEAADVATLLAKNGFQREAYAGPYAKYTRGKFVVEGSSGESSHISYYRTN